MTFVFYDLETTGTSPAFDQPLQFAAIRTDDDFNGIERVNSSEPPSRLASTDITLASSRSACSALLGAWMVA